MLDKFAEEQNEWYSKYLDIRYFSSWKKNYIEGVDSTTPSLEFTFARKCNLKCTYCYYTNHGKELYPDAVDKLDVSLANIQRLLNFLLEEKMLPSRLELFSGEAVSYVQYEQLFNMLFEFQKRLPAAIKKNYSILFPLNVIFLENQAYYNLLIEQQARFKQEQIVVYYSISIDGKYCDPISRPAHDSSFEYSDDFYKRVQQFSRDCSIPPGFHPMISSDNIHMWKQNFNWWLDFVADTYNIPVTRLSKVLYLLEVRNDDWTIATAKLLAEFIEYAYDIIYERICEKDKTKLLNDFFLKTGFNISSSLISVTARGLTCSLQTCMYVRTGDLAIIPCHRLSYEQYIGGRFEVEADKITGRISAVSPFMQVATASMNFRNQGTCASCEIRALCPGPCLGANFESTKDAFVPSPAMCRMLKAKQLAIIKVAKKNGWLEDIYSLLGADNDIAASPSEGQIHMRMKVNQIKYLESIIAKKEL